MGCPDSDRMIGELREQMAGGGYGHCDYELVRGEVWAYGAGGSDSRRVSIMWRGLLRWRCFCWLRWGLDF